MTTTGLPSTTLADLSRVTESVEMLAPRWSVWVLMTLAREPLRYAEIKPRLPWLADGQLHPRLRKLSEAGLVERTEYTKRHVTYGLTRRGAELMPVLSVIADWGDTLFEKDMVVNSATGKRELERIPPAQNVEDGVAMLSPRHATAILWTLQVRGTSRAEALAAVVLPGANWVNIYPPLHRLVRDGLVDTAGESETFQLSADGRALAPVYRALSAWSAGRPLADAGNHPVWGDAPAPAGPGAWITTASRRPVAQVNGPALATQPPEANWHPGDLFSHGLPARAAAPAHGGGPRR
ncbi:helix-turn-helix domain-containing protein [Streptomyces sp. NPDC088141]|uniref:winged helix-turn-helix transcriptional regulator n=1 Tax=Streptomyces sp. NPDC088141 TaxID=3155179 RepID=UPI00341AADA1